MSINRTNRTFSPVLMEEEYWANSHLSVARHYGGIKLSGANYYIVNKEGKDLFECSAEAEREGREKAIEPGEPADLVHEKFIPFYRKMGRERFIEVLKGNRNSDHETLMNIYREQLKKEKGK